MSLLTNLQNFTTRVATEFKAVRSLISGTATGDTSGLQTSDKTLVGAINEVRSAVPTSADLDARIQTIIGTAPDALDTLQELANAIGDDANFAATVTDALGKRLRLDTTQSLTAAQKAKGQENLGVYSKEAIGDPTTDLVAAFEAALA